jgi:hypothetical protein
VIPLYVVVAVLVMNVVCAALAFRAAKRRDYVPRYFLIGGLLFGPAALHAARHADDYLAPGEAEDGTVTHKVSDVPFSITGRPVTPAVAAPPIVIDGGPPAFVPGETHTSGFHVEGATTQPSDLGPLRGDEPVEAAAPLATPLTAPSAAEVTSDEQASAPLTAAPEVPRWGTRSGDDSAVARDVLEVLRADPTEKRSREARVRADETDAVSVPDEKVRKGGLRGKLSGRRGKNDTAPVPPVPAAPVPASALTAASAVTFGSDTQEIVPVPRESAEEEIVPVEPTAVTHGTCKVCNTQSYADWYGLCANSTCGAPWPTSENPAKPSGGRRSLRLR